MSPQEFRLVNNLTVDTRLAFEQRDALRAVLNRLAELEADNARLWAWHDEAVSRVSCHLCAVNLPQPLKRDNEMSAELVRRLRLGFFSDVATEIASKAADEIERLTAERDHAVRRAEVADEEMREACRRAVEWQDECCDRQNRVVELEAERDAMSAQLRAAGEKLRIAAMAADWADVCHATQLREIVTPVESSTFSAVAPVPQPQEARDAELLAALSRALTFIRWQVGGPADDDGEACQLAEYIAAILAAKEKK